MKTVLITLIGGMIALLNCTEPINSNASNYVPENIDSTRLHYAWLEDYQVENTLINRIPPPEGFERVKVEEGSFGEWLRHIPFKESGATVVTYAGDPVHSQHIRHAVLDIDIGDKDLQQCADAVMRLRAEYHWANEDVEKLSFTYTSGDPARWKDWRSGQRPQISGNLVNWKVTAQENNSYSNFRKYLENVFTYCGTYSLSKSLLTVEPSNLSSGDVFIQGGFPGHAVLVMDVAIHPETGKKVFLIAQSYMPAQSIHILENTGDPKISPWYELKEEGDFPTAEWTQFTFDDIKRFP